LSREDAWAKRSVSANIDTPEEDNKGHALGLWRKKPRFAIASYVCNRCDAGWRRVIEERVANSPAIVWRRGSTRWHGPSPVTPHHEGTGTSPITVAFEETSLDLRGPILTLPVAHGMERATVRINSARLR
jgi:hypothetical protein